MYRILSVNGSGYVSDRRETLDEARRVLAVYMGERREPYYAEVVDWDKGEVVFAEGNKDVAMAAFDKTQAAFALLVQESQKRKARLVSVEGEKFDSVGPFHYGFVDY